MVGGEDSSLASFMSCVEECISERECRKFEEGLNINVELARYKVFGKNVNKMYLHVVSDAGTRLLFKFRSGTHGLNEELGMHRENVLCVVLSVRTWCMCCGSVRLIVVVELVLW